MRVLILGAGDAFTRKHFGTSALIETAQRHVLIDCPDPIHRVLHEATAKHGWRVDALGIDDIILTHLHGDHSNGLESLGFFRRIARDRGMSDATPRIHTSEPAAARLWEKLAPAMDGRGRPEPQRTLGDFYEVHVLEPEAPATVAGLTVRCRFTRHPIPTIGLLISDGRVTLGWSGDTPFEQAHIDWLNEADLIVHEANVGPAHTEVAELNALPLALRRKMRLIHTVDDFDRGSTDIPVLDDGELLTI